MANLSITAADVICTPPTGDIAAISGEAFAVGDILYKKPSDGLYYKAVATSAEAAAAACMALTATAAAGQPFFGSRSLTIDVGAVTEGVLYFVAATAGKLCPESDLVSGNFKTLFGFGSSDSEITPSILATGFEI
jgi:hypothetical protein